MILYELTHGWSRDRKRGWGVQKKWPWRDEILSSAPQLALPGLVFILADLGDLT